MIQSIKTHHKPQMTCIILLRQHNDIATCGLDNKINIYTIDFYSNNYDLKKTFEGHENGILYIKELFKYNYLCSCSIDKTLKLWDLIKYECVFSLVAHRESVLCCDYCAKDDYIFSGSEDKSIIIWSKSLKKENYFQKKILRGHDKSVDCLVYVKQNNYLCSGSADRTIRIWDKEKDFDCIRIIYTNYENFSLQFGGNRLISTCEDGSIIFIDLNILQKVRSIKFSDSPVYDAKIYKDKEYLLIGCGDGLGIIWRVSTQERDLLDFHKKAIIGIFGLDNEKIISGSMDGLIVVWDKFKNFPKKVKIKKKKKKKEKIKKSTDSIESSEDDEENSYESSESQEESESDEQKGGRKVIYKKNIESISDEDLRNKIYQNLNNNNNDNNNNNNNLNPQNSVTQENNVNINNEENK